MPSLSAQDRVSLCTFTFSDGRRCRSRRTRNNPCFCFDHAQKEARANAAQRLGKDLDYFFSGDYLSACDLCAALGRLLPAVIRGDVKPRTARTVAYLAQTLLQTIHISQDEYVNAFGADGWRRSIRNSVNANHDYRFPPAPKSAQPASCSNAESVRHVVAGLQTGVGPAQPNLSAHSPSPVCHPERSEGSQPIPATQPSLKPPPTQPPAPSPHTPLPPTSADFVQHVVAGLQTGSSPATPNVQSPSPAPQPASPPAPNRVSDHSLASNAQPTPSSQHPTAPPTTSPLRSSTAPHRFPQQPPPPESLSSVASTPSVPQQEPRPATSRQTDPSGLPVLADLPTRTPGAS